MDASPTAERFVEELEEHRSEEELRKIRRYFKTGEGEYGEGDTFMGVRMGQVFELAREYIAMEPAEIEKLLARSENMWERRTAVYATTYLICAGRGTNSPSVCAPSSTYAHRGCRRRCCARQPRSSKRQNATATGRCVRPAEPRRSASARGHRGRGATGEAYGGPCGRFFPR